MNIAIALSGGVDSSTCLIKLMEANNNVCGITMILDDDEVYNNNVKDAKSICDKYNIPHYILNLKKEFNNKVIKYFINEYLMARTPNPCLICNPLIKFGALKKYANNLGYEYLATGHYAIIEKKDNRYYLKKGLDKTKEQSYFLSLVPYEILETVILPLGEYTKDDTRNFLRKRNIHIAEKSESQEICFIKDNDYRRFLRENAPQEQIKSGNILDENGIVVGEHQGLPFYTIGQRRGVNVAMGKPVYVRELNPENNTVIIGEKKKTKTFIVKNINILVPFEDIDKKQIDIKIRYRSKTVPCEIKKINNDSIKIVLHTAQSSVTPGQGAVLYNNDIVIAGGIIDKLLE